jgi:hypothetical protein
VSLDLEMNESSTYEFDIENELFFSQLSPDYKDYYDMITSIILGEYDSAETDDEIFMACLFSKLNLLLFCCC